MNQNQWKPIKTAPIDGTPVLLSCRHKEHRFSELGWWEPQFHARYNTETDEFAYSGAWTNGYQDESEDSVELTPTHWMALPEHPKDAE